MTNFPVASTDAPVAPFIPVIPLNYFYPGLSLAQISSIAWARRKMIFLIGLVVLSLTVLVIKVWPRTYSATATLMVSYQVDDPLNGTELPISQLGSYIATQVELLQTPEVLLAVVDRLGLTGDEEYTSGYRGRGSLREWVAAQLRKDLSINQGQGGSQLIYVTFAAHEPEVAARVANTVSDIYKEQDFVRSTEPPGARARVYEQELVELKAKVDQAQTAVTAFHQENGLIEEKGQSDANLVLLAALEGRLLEAQNLRHEAASRALEDPDVSDQALNSEFVQSLRTQIAGQELALAQHNAMYTRKYPGLIELERTLAASRASLASALRGYTDNAAAALSSARMLERDLQKEISEQRAKTLAEGQLRDQARKYLLELDSAQLVYKRALEGYDQLMFAARGHNSNVSFISRAAPPVIPSKPRVFKGLMLGAMLAAALGLGIPLALELFNRRVRCRDDIERQYGIPVLAEFGRLTQRSGV